EELGRRQYGPDEPPFGREHNRLGDLLLGDAERGCLFLCGLGRAVMDELVVDVLMCELAGQGTSGHCFPLSGIDASFIPQAFTGTAGLPIGVITDSGRGFPPNFKAATDAQRCSEHSETATVAHYVAGGEVSPMTRHRSAGSV